ncbi:endonuclease/exonuclease/phosphatase family protein [Dactylosporangium sp. CA-139114]|uniref:endonuclease/exonuclease/phosphatase family protein n=1 Tax=Dactylosporangium sp. CA-139114 TaxID=3239931 RepID=UPI003D9766ED
MTTVLDPAPAPAAARSRPVLPLVVAALWPAFVLAHLVLSGRWWLWLVPDIVPPLVFTAVPVVLAAGAAPFRRLRRPVALLSLAALIPGVCISGWNVAALWTSPTAPPPGALTVFSWNTEYWDSDGGPFYPFLQRQHADVYLLQEYLNDGDIPTPVHDLERLRAAFPGYHIAVAGELVTVSRLPILRTYPLPADVPLTDTGWVAEFVRDKILRTDIDLGSGTVLSVYNLHLPVQLSPGLSVFDGAFWRTVRDQHAQREPQLRALTADVDANRNPILVAGDFNTSPAMGDLRKIPPRLHDAGALLPLYPASWRDRDGLPRWWRLDWAYTTSDVRVHSYDFGRTDGQSDHSFQLLRISV